jgi:hypothetical protein
MEQAFGTRLRKEASLSGTLRKCNSRSGRTHCIELYYPVIAWAVRVCNDISTCNPPGPGVWVNNANRGSVEGPGVARSLSQVTGTLTCEITCESID